MLACGDVVVVVAMHNAMTADDVAAVDDVAVADDVVAVVGATATVDV